jgi:hypothetical protein
VAILVSGGVGAGAPGSLLTGEAGAPITAPDVVLLLEIGGLQVVALVIMLTHHPATLRWGRVLGVGVAIAVGIGAATLGGYGLLNSIAIMAGLLELALVLTLLAILPHVARRTAKEKALQTQGQFTQN